ncbi:MAG: hypothetical protein GF421_06445 [Candidatus Aminicenantes bacterium]|nr:hypothetical protein [Candidatus Aminicenantes bacterium]
MAKASENTKIVKADLDFIKEKLSKQNKVPSLSKLTESLAYKKNARQLNQDVLKYNPSCKYEVNDLICKKYDEPLVVSSKEKKHYKGKVVLKVTNKINYPDYNCEMLEVDYSGGGLFRRHIDYMKRKNTQVLLPAATEDQAKPPESIKKEDDPRLHKLPMTERDMKILSTNLRKAISKSDEFFGWNEHWQMTNKKVQIPDKTIKKIEKHLKKDKKSASTEEIVEKFLNTKPKDDKFDIYCLSLNFILNKKYKKTFLCVSPKGWGRWFLKEILKSFLKGKPLAMDKAELPDLEKGQYESIKAKEQKFPLRIYLSWREILSGGIKMPPELNRDLSESREYKFTDEEESHDVTVYYYPSRNIFLGLDEFYKKHHIPQGASLTLKRKDSNHISFRLKKSKKKISLPSLEYHPKNDDFSIADKEVPTFAHPNKIIYIEHETLKNLLKLSEQKKDKNLRELLITVFKNFGFEGERQTLHYRKAFHLVDILKHTSLNDIEKTLCLSPEFEMSEKKKGLFFYHEKIKTEKELELEKPSPSDEQLEPKTEEVKSKKETLPEIGTVGEISTPEIHLEEKKEIKPPEKKKAVKKKKEKKPKPKPARAKKEKEVPFEEPLPERKPRKTEKKEVDFAKPARSKKGKKRIIEEQIEQEESELEAFFAVKTDEDKEMEEDAIEHLKTKPEKKKKKKKYTQTDEGPLSGGLFGEKLKSALGQDKNKESEKKKK